MSVDAPVEQLGLVALDLKLVSTEKNELHLNSVPTFICNSPFSLLIGQNLLHKLSMVMTYKGPTAYLSFQRVKGFGSIPTTILDNEYTALELNEAACVQLPPKIWSTLTFCPPFAQASHSSSLDGKQMLIELNPDYAESLQINHAEVATFRKGKIEIGIMPTGSEVVQLLPHQPVFVVSPLSNHIAEIGRASCGERVLWVV